MVESNIEDEEKTTTKTESKNRNLGKYEKKALYLNHGKYGYFLSHNKVNYKIPEWFPPEKIDLDIASRLIEYKLKFQEIKSNESE